MAFVAGLGFLNLIRIMPWWGPANSRSRQFLGFPQIADGPQHCSPSLASHAIRPLSFSESSPWAGTFTPRHVSVAADHTELHRHMNKRVVIFGENQQMKGRKPTFCLLSLIRNSSFYLWRPELNWRLNIRIRRNGWDHQPKNLPSTLSRTLALVKESNLAKIPQPVVQEV